MNRDELIMVVDRYADAAITERTWREALPYVEVGAEIVDLSRKYLGAVHEYPVSLGCALVEGESWFRNLFGCDWGSRWTYDPPFCQVMVTKQRVQRLIQNIENGGGQNGVGLTQLTSINFIRRAEKMGGAHIPRIQLVIGFQLLGKLIRRYGYYGGVGAYNAGPGGMWDVRWTYTQALENRHNKWIQRLT